MSFVFYPIFSGMPTNPLEKQFALLGTASTAGLLDVQKAYRSLCHIVVCVTAVIAFFPSSGVDQQLLSCFRKKVLSLAVSATGSGKLEEISQAFVEVRRQS